MQHTLPVWLAFRSATSATASNLRLAWRLSWPWIAIVLVVTMASSFLIVEMLGHAPSAVYTRLGPAVANILNFAAPPDYKIILVHNAFLFLVLMAAMSAIAVHWHRHLILDETPRLREIVSFDRTKLRYLWAFILVTIVPAGIAFAVGAAKTSIARDETEQLVGTALFLITIFPLCAILFMRLGTMLPAIAIGRRDVSPSVAWTATRGNSHTVLALFLLYLATLAAGHAASLAIGGVFSAFSYAVADWVFYWLRLAVNWFVTILAITIFTVLHRAFIEEPST